MTDKMINKRPRGMANLAATLTGRTDDLARRSTEEALAAPPRQPSGSESDVPTDTAKSHEANQANKRTGSVKGFTATSETAGEPATRLSLAVGTAVQGEAFSGPEGSLDASGEPVVKWTLELAPQIIMALNVWERDETRRLGQRVFRERLIDRALDQLPGAVESILDVVSEMPLALRHARSQQFGTRVRASVRDKLLLLRPELRVAGVKNVRTRDIYSAGVYRYLRELGVDVDDSTPKPRKR